MPTSREGDVIARIKEKERDCEQAYLGYRRGEGTTRINRCNRELAALQDELWRVQSGRMPKYDREP